MNNASPRVDAYIEEAPEFAQPILAKLRRIFHKASPKIEENIKWNAPSFEHKGIVAGMMAFKKHVGFGFMKAPLLKDPTGLFKDAACESISMVKVTKVSELPPEKVLIPLIVQAVELNEQGVQVTRKKRAAALKVPGDLAAALALKKHKKARETFENFSPSKRKEYIEWITGAKREATRRKRLATTLEWLAEGKPRNWKYMK